jgi:hypothetical protein
MPTYDFKCRKCGQIDENIIMPITHQREDLPWHCGERMSYHITQAPMVSWTDPVIEPFRNPAAARGDKDAVITSMKQRREFMEKHDLVDANDLPPPSQAEVEKTRAEIEESVAAITPTKEQTDQMKSDGIAVDIVE